MLVLVAHNGKTFGLDYVIPSTRIDELQKSLVELTRVETKDQILMYGGNPLDATKILGHYNLPGSSEEAVEKEVFLYNKTHLRPGGPLPPPEELQHVPIETTEAGPPRPHPLDHAASPLLRALPEYERLFWTHQDEGLALVRATRKRHEAACNLLSEVQVQALATEAARTNINNHYNYINHTYNNFRTEFEARHQARQDIFDRFGGDMAFLENVELHPGAIAAGYRTVADLVPRERLRTWAAECAETHKLIYVKVRRQDDVFDSIKADVEALLMQAPSVNFDNLGAQLASLETCLPEQAAVADRLVAHHGEVQGLIEQAVKEVERSGGEISPLESCQVMEQINANHVTQLLPRVRHFDRLFADFCPQCVEAKNVMTEDLMGQLQRISLQQSRIRKMRESLSLLTKLLDKLDNGVMQLQIPCRVLIAYRHCLTECRRREAFNDVYALKANKMAEAMGRLRDKEVDQRDKFRNHVEALIPKELLAALGLDAFPPHCQISVPQQGGTPVANVSEADVRRVPIPQPQGSAVTSPHASSPLTTPAPTPAFAASMLVSEQAGGTLPPAGDASPDVYGGVQCLEMENARLRADIATMRAAECARASMSFMGGSTMVGSVAARPSGMGGSETPRGADSPGEAAALFTQALTAKDQLVDQLEREVAAARGQAAAYETRIRLLEGQLSSRSEQGGLLPDPGAPLVARPPLQPALTDPTSLPYGTPPPSPSAQQPLPGPTSVPESLPQPSSAEEQRQATAPTPASGAPPGVTGVSPTGGDHGSAAEQQQRASTHMTKLTPAVTAVSGAGGVHEEHPIPGKQQQATSTLVAEPTPAATAVSRAGHEDTAPDDEQRQASLSPAVSVPAATPAGAGVLANLATLSPFVAAAAKGLDAITGRAASVASGLPFAPSTEASQSLPSPSAMGPAHVGAAPPTALGHVFAGPALATAAGPVLAGAPPADPIAAVGDSEGLPAAVESLREWSITKGTAAGNAALLPAGEGADPMEGTATISDTALRQPEGDEGVAALPQSSAQPSGKDETIPGQEAAPAPPGASAASPEYPHAGVREAVEIAPVAVRVTTAAAEGEDAPEVLAEVPLDES